MNLSKLAIKQEKVFENKEEIYEKQKKIAPELQKYNPSTTITKENH
jgi:hypothetical protein